MQALPSGQMINRHIKALLSAVALAIFVIPACGQSPAIEPCPATPSKPGITAGPQKVGSRFKRLGIDASIPDDPEVEKLIKPYAEKVRELSQVIGRLEGDLKK